MQNLIRRIGTVRVESSGAENSRRDIVALDDADLITCWFAQPILAQSDRATEDKLLKIRYGRLAVRHVVSVRPFSLLKAQRALDLVLDPGNHSEC